MNIWLTIIAIGLITFAIRLSFIALSDRITLPPLAQRALRFVPVAVLTAIVIPDLVLHDGAPDLAITNARLLAGIIAIAVAWRTHNIIATLISGMAALWILRFALHLS